MACHNKTPQRNDDKLDKSQAAYFTVFLIHSTQASSDIVNDSSITMCYFVETP